MSYTSFRNLFIFPVCLFLFHYSKICFSLLFQPTTKSNTTEATSGTVPERASSPGGCSDIDSGTDSQTHEDTAK